MVYSMYYDRSVVDPDRNPVQLYSQINGLNLGIENFAGYI